MNKVAKTKHLHSSTALHSHRTYQPVPSVSGAITTPAAKLGSYAVRTGRSAYQCTSLYSPPVLSSCSQTLIVIPSLPTCALDWLAEAKWGWRKIQWAGRGKLQVPLPHHPLDFYPWPQHKIPLVLGITLTQFTHIMKVVKTIIDCTRQVNLPFWCS